MLAETAIFETDLPLPNRRAGKVRDCYDLPLDPQTGRPRLLIVATDRLSAFDVVLPTPIPGKGRILTSVATEWFRFLRPRGIVADHLISTQISDLRDAIGPAAEALEGRFMICRGARVIPIECVVRGYLAGSAWQSYCETGTICGITLPPGLPRCAELEEPIFTPATKAAQGHDENIDFQEACRIAGPEVMERLRAISIELYRVAAAHARACGLILADTKFEFGWAADPRGRPTEELLLIDEILTPDSARFWPADAYRPGEEPAGFDKQFVRNHLLELCTRGEWDRNPPGPALPPEVVKRTRERYAEASKRLFGLDDR